MYKVIALALVIACYIGTFKSDFSKDHLDKIIASAILVIIFSIVATILIGILL